VRIAATHLGLRRWERSQQIDRILGRMQSPKARRTILLGDFNEWWPWSRNLHRLKSPFRHSVAPATFSSRWPILALDHILVSPDLKIKKYRAFKQPETRSASDHLPLTARIVVPF
ncbi:MAG: endonuclease/exonuclease/phosphatase family protein, partial [Desulfuromonadales bacterium]